MHIVDKCQGTSALATSLDRRTNPHTLAHTYAHENKLARVTDDHTVHRLLRLTTKSVGPAATVVVTIKLDIPIQ